MKIILNYPSANAEAQIIRLIEREEQAQEKTPAPLDPRHILDARKAVQMMHRSDAIVQYIVDLIMATREPEKYPDSPLSKWISTGSSPRASLALMKCAKASAFLNGKTYVDPEDLRQVVHAVLRHRLILSYDALADGITPDQVIDEILKQVAVA